MPRTIEHIVSTHQAARALRAAGKPIWALEVRRFKDTLHGHKDLPDAERALMVMRDLVALLRSSLPEGAIDDPAHAMFSYDLYDAVGEMEDMTAAEIADIDAEGTKPLDLVDHYATAVYNWADIHRVWLG